MRFLLVLVIFIIISLPLSAQSWTITKQSSIPQTGIKDITPSKYSIANLDDDKMKRLLWSAPSEVSYKNGLNQPLSINVMLADNSIDKFEIVEYSMMEPELAAKFPGIKTFHGFSTSDPLRKIRIDYTVHGFRAIISDESGQTYIDHYQRGDKKNKIIYRKKDYIGTEDWSCDTHDHKPNVENGKQRSSSQNRMSGDCIFRSYRLSVTATGEYSNYHGATSSAQSNLVLSAVTTTINRINNVFEQDVTVRFILIGNNDDIFYYDSNSDPFTGNDADAMINQNQTNTDDVIESANYDIGHIFSTGGSGLAGLGVLCSNNSKARGVSGISNPTGDPFDIDYVSHEVGHQLGAEHTQNNSCNRSTFSAREPGSASTIMGYAGICSPNVQNNSDAYFHAISIQQMNAEIASNNCHAVIDNTFGQPTVEALTDKAIPHSTPFVLEAVGNDPDGDALTYCWEQMDNEVGTMPPQGTNTGGPMFRSLFATASPKRYFPSIDNIINGTNDTWEVLPTVGRDMSFRVTVRDNTFLPGCTAEADMNITVAPNAGPFLVTDIDATPWLETDIKTIQWDVADTDISPVNCANVDILLSYDGGNTYPITLASEVPNNGSALITVPAGVSSTARLMIKCSDNVFFDINNNDFSIQAPTPSFSLNVDPAQVEICTSQDLTIEVLTNAVSGFSDPINLAVTGMPSGATASIPTNPVTPGNSSIITISNLPAQQGNYTLNINGTSGSTSDQQSFSFTIIESSSNSQSLISPADGAVDVSPSGIELSWTSVDNITGYRYQLLLNGSPIFSANTTETTVLTPELNFSTLYSWRVRNISQCGNSAWSEERTFETGACPVYSANDLPIDISASGTSTITSNFITSDKGIINDINIVNLTGSHSWVGDLSFTLTSPDDTNLDFWSNPCGDEDNFNINFDDEAASGSFPCPPIDGNSYIPENPLSVYNTKQIQGQWSLEVSDNANGDGGSLDSWGIEVCVDQYCDLTVTRNQYDINRGSLKEAINCATNGDTIFLESILSGVNINTGSESIIIDKSIIVKANRMDNILIDSESNTPALQVESGVTVTLIGFDINNYDTSNGVILNNGTLNLIDVNVGYGTGNPSVINNSVLNIDGECNIKQE